MAKLAKYLTILGMLFNVAWFLWNPEGWKFEWEPIVAFTLTLAGFIAADIHDKPKETTSPNDIALFKKFQECLPINGAIKFIKEHDFLGSFTIEEISPFNRFVYEWENPEHEFIDIELEALRKELYGLIKEFTQAIGRYSSPNSMGRQSVRVHSQEGIPEFEKKFEQEAGIINNAASAVEACHSNLIRVGRKKLNLA
ncbi:hypothetical protein [Cellvibrio sp. PSBB023]|uniref:hypothetical protein n=1 Tax=Cellvibrio sp. PSBB023 TaxID=1945512 RepID=UPI00098FD99E|nr:hypothetical protein [Cellvibrio sp. PSBB023]AQT58895.1 hypothetical protein B0D95_01415 [Cellvibrio sp. PSBB023]